MAPRPAAAIPAVMEMDELVEEFLVRIPPDDPARLVHAALVCKRWCRIVSGRGFRRRLGEFHRTPPMLGLVCHRGAHLSDTFVPTTSFRPSCDLIWYDTVDARHGRVLLHGAVRWDIERIARDDYFEIWDPMAAENERAVELPLVPQSRTEEESDYPERNLYWNAAVLCAAPATAGHACDHLDCRGGHFLVVFVTRATRWGMPGLCALVYSSEAAAWSQPIHATHLDEEIQSEPSVLLGNSLYFLCRRNVLKFDLATREMSLIGLPQNNFGRCMPRVKEDCGLGLATVCANKLYLWSREVGPDEDVGWTQTKVINLSELLLAQHAIPIGRHGSIRLAGTVHGLDVILVSTRVGIFTIHVNSDRAIKVCEDNWLGCSAFPYMSFYMPALGVAASAE